MPTQRSFFSGFFSAFRARSSPTFQAKTSTTTGAVSGLSYSTTAQATTQSAQAQIQASRILQVASTTKPSSSSANTDVQPQTHAQGTSIPIQPLKSVSAGPSTHVPYATHPLSSSPSAATTFHTHYLPRPSRPPSPTLQPHSHAIPVPVSMTRQRRGSGSSHSSGGFVDAGQDKWYVGGQNASGQERFYQLGVITANGGRSARSLDRLSL